MRGAGSGVRRMAGQPHIAARPRQGARLAYVTFGDLNEVKVFHADNFKQVATIPVGSLPYGIWANRRRHAGLRRVVVSRLDRAGRRAGEDIVRATRMLGLDARLASHRGRSFLELNISPMILHLKDGRYVIHRVRKDGISFVRDPRASVAHQMSLDDLHRQ